MNIGTLESVYTISGQSGDPEYRVEVRRGRYNPVRRATMHSVEIFVNGTDIRVASTSTVSARESCVTPAVEDALARRGIILK